MISIEDVPCVPCQKGYNGIHTCESPDYCPCDRAGQHQEKQYLACIHCGEVFDSITFAQEHGISDLRGAGWCGDSGFHIIPESEAF